MSLTLSTEEKCFFEENNKNNNCVASLRQGITNANTKTFFVMYSSF